MRKVSGSECKRKRKPIYPNGGWPKDLLNGFKSNIYTVRNEKLKDERKYKHKKFLRSFPKDKGKRRKRIKVRERKKFRYFGGKACGVSERKRSKVRWETRIRSKIERVRTKTEDEEKKLESAKKFKIFDGIFLGEKTNGSRTENFQVFDNEKETGVESKRVIVENRPEKSGSNVKKKVESKNLKSETWPHFIYHRVSSNFLHPESKTRNRHPSAYVAISVAASSDSGSKS